MQVCPPPWPLAVVPGHALSTAVGLGGKPPCCTAITQPGNHTARSPETLSDPGNVDDGSLEMFLQICKMHSFCKE